MLQIWWSSLTAADRGVLDLLSATERARVESLERAADRGRSMVGAALVRVAVGAHLGVDPASVIVDRTCRECGRPHGAPRIVGSGRGASGEVMPRVSVSHSGVLVVVALSDGPVGVDVQRAADLDDPAQAEAWVRREAALKFHAVATLDDVEEPVVRTLEPPRPGYVTALATSGGTPDQHDPLMTAWNGDF